MSNRTIRTHEFPLVSKDPKKPRFLTVQVSHYDGAYRMRIVPVEKDGIWEKTVAYSGIQTTLETGRFSQKKLEAYAENALRHEKFRPMLDRVLGPENVLIEPILMPDLTQIFNPPVEVAP